jgi:hypothetical protein
MEQRYIDRFHTKYKIDSNTHCWNWTGFRNRLGYGQYWDGNKVVLAHRFSALINNIDTTTPVIRHLCNNPSCVNPDHLAPGTHSDNMDDKVNSGRCPTGSSHSNAKLTEHAAQEIRSKYIPYKYTIKMLAKEYSVSTSTILLIIQRKHWKHI